MFAISLRLTKGEEKGKEKEEQRITIIFDILNTDRSKILGALNSNKI